ncbi:hypothetical protein PLICRDRAFT_37509 [Plicaturopsis crispa FD-325 SS-3]|nr:hypothetical protein PLICRDRAFT_37509 [Plicaturopsis crispa FD-325 SS-3]
MKSHNIPASFRLLWPLLFIILAHKMNGEVVALLVIFVQYRRGRRILTLKELPGLKLSKGNRYA